MTDLPEQYEKIRAFALLMEAADHLEDAATLVDRSFIDGNLLDLKQALLGYAGELAEREGFDPAALAELTGYEWEE